MIKLLLVYSSFFFGGAIAGFVITDYFYTKATIKLFEVIDGLSAELKKATKELKNESS